MRASTHTDAAGGAHTHAASPAAARPAPLLRPPHPAIGSILAGSMNRTRAAALQMLDGAYGRVGTSTPVGFGGGTNGFSGGSGQSPTSMTPTAAGGSSPEASRSVGGATGTPGKMLVLSAPLPSNVKSVALGKSPGPTRYERSIDPRAGQHASNAADNFIMTSPSAARTGGLFSPTATRTLGFGDRQAPAMARLSGPEPARGSMLRSPPRGPAGSFIAPPLKLSSPVRPQDGVAAEVSEQIDGDPTDAKPSHWSISSVARGEGASDIVAGPALFTLLQSRKGGPSLAAAPRASGNVMPLTMTAAGRSTLTVSGPAGLRPVPTAAPNAVRRDGAGIYTQRSQPGGSGSVPGVRTGSRPPSQSRATAPRTIVGGGLAPSRGRTGPPGQVSSNVSSALLHLSDSPYRVPPRTNSRSSSRAGSRAGSRSGSRSGSRAGSRTNSRSGPRSSATDSRSTGSTTSRSADSRIEAHAPSRPSSRTPSRTPSRENRRSTSGTRLTESRAGRPAGAAHSSAENSPQRRGGAGPPTGSTTPNGKGAASGPGRPMPAGLPIALLPQTDVLDHEPIPRGTSGAPPAMPGLIDVLGIPNRRPTASCGVESLGAVSWRGRNPAAQKINQDGIIVAEHAASRSLLVAVFDGHGQNGRDVSQFLRDRYAHMLFSSDRFLAATSMHDEPSSGPGASRAGPAMRTTTAKSLSVDHGNDVEVLGIGSDGPLGTSPGGPPASPRRFTSPGAPHGGSKDVDAAGRDAAAAVLAGLVEARAVCDAMSHALLELEAELIRSSGINCGLSGATATVVLIRAGFAHVINVGDSRGILISSSLSKSHIDTVLLQAASSAATADGSPLFMSPSRESPSSAAAHASTGYVDPNSVSFALPAVRPVVLTVDHKPDLPRERQRIIASGGRVMATRIRGMPQAVGPLRVWLKSAPVPGLNMSRSIGDLIAKQAGVISTPHKAVRALTEDDRACVIASDGIWDWVTSEEVAALALSSEDTWEAATRIARLSRARWLMRTAGADDTSLIILRFGAQPDATGSRAPGSEPPAGAR